MEIYPLRFFPPLVMEASGSTRMVQSVTLHKHGKLDRIRVEDAPIERRLIDHYVEVEVYYCGLSFTDNYLRLGIIRNDLFPVIMGSECGGVITAVGKDVTDLQVGQRVLCLRLQGGLFRHVVHVPRRYCYVVPDDMSLRTAVSFGISSVLAYLILFNFNCPERTKTIFMDSIGGAVGTAVIALARTIPGVKILGTASETKHAKLLSLGVEHVYRHEDKFVDEVLKVYPEGVDLVINTEGGKQFDLEFKMLRPTGRLISIGTNRSVSHPQTTYWGLLMPTWDNKQLTTAEMIRNNYTIAGVNVGRLLQHHREIITFVLNRIFELHTDGRITPCVHSIQPFERVVDGFTMLCERQNCGKVLLAVDKKTDIWDAPIAVSGPAIRLPRYLGPPKRKDEQPEVEGTGEASGTTAEAGAEKSTAGR